jgi:uncharacterized protein with PIN domain
MKARESNDSGSLVKALSAQSKARPLTVSKCPVCEARLSFVNVEPMPIQKKTTVKIAGVSYFCPKCQSILSVGIDPAALNADLLRDVERVVQKWR